MNIDSILKEARDGWEDGGDWVTHAEAKKQIQELIVEAQIDELKRVMDGEDSSSPRYKRWEERIIELKEAGQHE